MPTPTDRAQHHLAQALTREDPAVVNEHIRAALAELDRPERLVECRECGRAGLEARMVCSYCAE